MAFATRCPECQGKLVLDERPARGVPVECSHCGNVFNPPPPKPRPRDEDDEPVPAKRSARRPAADRPDRPGKTATAPAPNKPKLTRTVRKKPMNPMLLLAMVASGFGLYTMFYYGVEAYLGKAGRATELMAFVPPETNHLRGVNVAGTVNYPGYAGEVAKHITPDVRAAADKLAEAAGQDPADFLDYYMCARQREGRDTVLHLIRADKKLKLAAFGDALVAAGATAAGDSAYHFGGSGPGILRNSTVAVQSQYVIVIAPDGPAAKGLLAQSAEGKGGADGVNFLKHFEDSDTIKVCTRGAIWLVIRQTGSLKNFVGSSTEKLKDDNGLKLVYDQGAKAPVFGCWATPGGSGVIIGAGFETDDSTAARDLRSYLQDGPLGKADESEPTNQLKQSGLRFVSDKRVFGEFMQYCTFKNNGDCAYLRSEIKAPDAIPTVMGVFADPQMGLGAAYAAPAGGAGGPGAQGGQGGGQKPGLPGGIALPGG